MIHKTEIDLRDISRVVMSGTASYLAVHYFLLPQLVHWGVSFPTYFYIGVVVTGGLAVVINLLFQARDKAAPRPDLHPAE
ncbi:hypothetical protein KUL25_21005 [Rhodobacteraceae bacterium N5(2021)]|uniref:Uncharacterized protein n=1 Tax=Gymnodinialimonas phycosphaerae TaxID=2841589 RepID=A0A975TWA6_9RHOB|nr:hypothetical protein [Gymnodinialimonas phycosphaerae]MBY4895248.1 hypothetical protein [Gymnodinialimonas phycosphaerae]